MINLAKRQNMLTPVCRVSIFLIEIQNYEFLDMAEINVIFEISEKSY